jgi:hypothetical protein
MRRPSTTAPCLASLAVLAAIACGDPDSTPDASGSSGPAPGTETAPSTSTPTTGADTTTAGADTSTGGIDDDPCDDSPDAVADCVEAERYAADLEFVADIRTPGSAHWQAVQDLCFDRLTEFGYEVDLQEYGSGVNVIGRRVGSTAPDDIVLIGAHYDHIPDCHGADDNATGVAAALEIARVLAGAPLDRTVMVACWDEEELGLVGSAAFAAQAAQDGTDIVINFNFDMIGFSSSEPGSQEIPAGLDLAFPDAYAEIEANEFRGDFIAMMANAGAAAAAEDFLAQADRVGLRGGLLALPAGTETADLFADLRRSDHASFWDQGYAALFLTDSGEFRNPNYHCMAGPDEIVDLDEAFAVQVARATAGAAASAAGL